MTKTSEKIALPDTERERKCSREQGVGWRKRGRKNTEQTLSSESTGAQSRDPEVKT